MASKVTAQVVGGEPKVFDNVKTVRDLMSTMELGESYTASINGEPVSKEDYEAPINDYAFVSFAENVKGGR